MEYDDFSVMNYFSFQFRHGCAALSRFVLSCWSRIVVLLWRRRIECRSPGRDSFELWRIFIIIVHDIRRWTEKDSFGIIAEFEF